ncbi:MAG: hypothetical protein GC159_13880 [Phycisphaera sp.]|nr:hypothetical protein [Phycisphaera sp.]
MPKDETPEHPLPAHKSRSAVVTFVAVFTILLVADLALKGWSYAHVAPVPVDPGAVSLAIRNGDPPPIPPHDNVTLIPKVIALKLVANPGAVFGMMAGARWLFVGFTVLAVTFVGYVFCTSSAQHRLIHVCLGMILAGAIGNLYDRIAYGFVRDMLYLFPDVNLPFGWSWDNGSTELYPWIFNLADSYLLIGIGSILVWSLLFDRKPTSEEDTPKTAQK